MKEKMPNEATRRAMAELNDGKAPRFRSLDEMIADITDKNLHPETDWGPDVGKEIVES